MLELSARMPSRLFPVGERNDAFLKTRDAAVRCRRLLYAGFSLYGTGGVTATKPPRSFSLQKRERIGRRTDGPKRTLAAFAARAALW